MTTIFEDFAIASSSAASTDSSVQSKLDSFDTGYKAGWDDASKAHLESKKHISSVLIQNLETIEFTMAEARASTLKVLTPMITQITSTLLPGLKQEALRARLEDELESLLKNSVSGQIALEVSAGDLSTVKDLTDGDTQFQRVSVLEKPSLGEGQVYVSCEDQTHLIDIDKVLEDIREAVATEFGTSELEQAYAV